MHEEPDYCHARNGLEPLAEVDDLLAVDADAGLVGRFVYDGLLRGFSVVHVSAGEAPLTDRWYDAAFYDVRIVEFVQQNGVRYRRRLNPPRVRRVRVAASKLVPVVLVGVPLAERVVALVAPQGDEAGVDGGTAFEKADLIGHGVLLGVRRC